MTPPDIDVTHTVNQVARTVADRTLESGEGRVVTIGRTYDATVEELWDAVTNPERIPRWLAPVSGDLRLGGRYQLEGNAGGTITECDPPHRFAATWEFGDSVSWIEVRVSDEGRGRARVELDHIAPVEAHWDQFGPGAVGIGWDLATVGLGVHLSAGDAVSFDELQAWTASDEGKRYVAESGEGWYAADVASGTDPTDARRRSDATVAAFTGEG